MPASMRVRPPPKGVCRWCGQAILKPDGTPRNVTWHPECVTIYNIACHSSFQRSAVKRRDNGICALCGVDTLWMHRRHNWHLLMQKWRYAAARHAFTTSWHEEQARVEKRFRRWEEKLRRGMKNRQERAVAQGWRISHEEGAWWQADHIRPLIESQGRIEYFLLENLRTACHPCHVRKTKEDNARIKKLKTKPRESITT